MMLLVVAVGRAANAGAVLAARSAPPDHEMRRDGTVAVPLPMMTTAVMLTMMVLGRTLVMCRVMTGCFVLYSAMLVHAVCASVPTVAAATCCCPMGVISTTHAVPSFDWRSLLDQPRPG